MTVKELKEKLNNFNDAEIIEVVSDYNEDLTIKEIILSRQEEYIDVIGELNEFDVRLVIIS